LEKDSRYRKRNLCRRSKTETGTFDSETPDQEGRMDVNTPTSSEEEGGRLGKFVHKNLN
jgi:hypothetical protein